MQLLISKKTNLVNSIILHNPEIELNHINIQHFSDGEILPIIPNSVRNKEVHLLFQPKTSVDIMEMFLCIDATRRAGARKMNLILPYHVYSRQDKPDHNRSSIGSKMIADFIEKSGISTITTMDLHAQSIFGFYSIPLLQVNAMDVFIPYLKTLSNMDNTVLVSPDQGGFKRVSSYQKELNSATIAVINKVRIRPNEVASMDLIGNVKDKDVIIIDDIADTLGTLSLAAKKLKEEGANKIMAAITHPILSGKAYENLNDSFIDKLIVTDTLDVDLTKSNKIELLTTQSCFKKILNFV